MVRIALAQCNCIPGDVAANEQSMSAAMDAAGKGNADILVFPELCNTGCNPAILGDRLALLAQDANGSTLSLARRKAREHGMYVVPSMAYRENTAIFNASVLVDPGGNILQVYKKNHLWEKEQVIFSYGDHEYLVHSTPFGKIGLLICYDVDFPETSRILALRGAHIVFVSAAWATVYRNLWEIYLPSRALENTVFVAGVNRIGTEGDMVFFGSSRVYDPWGRLIARGGEHTEEVVFCDVNVQDTYVAREEFPYLKERRKEGYGGLNGELVSE